MVEEGGGKGRTQDRSWCQACRSSGERCTRGGCQREGASEREQGQALERPRRRLRPALHPAAALWPFPPPACQPNAATRPSATHATAAMVGDSWLGKHFQVIGDRTTHYGLFDCAPAPAAAGGGGDGGACC